MDPKKRSIDKATQEALKHVREVDAETAWERFEQQQPQCGFGKLGICCRNCSIGPCRVDPFEEGPQEGICGATADTIAARNLLQFDRKGVNPGKYADVCSWVQHPLRTNNPIL